MEPAAPEKLLEAFRVLDVDGKGTIGKEFISKLMIEEGEPFTQEELDEMLATAVDVQTGEIPYEYYINSLMVNIKSRSRSNSKQTEHTFFWLTFLFRLINVQKCVQLACAWSELGTQQAEQQQKHHQIRINE